MSLTCLFFSLEEPPSSSTAIQRGKSCILSIQYGKAFTNSTSTGFALSPCLVGKIPPGHFSSLSSFLWESPLFLYTTGQLLCILSTFHLPRLSNQPMFRLKNSVWVNSPVFFFSLGEPLFLYCWATLAYLSIRYSKSFTTSISNSFAISPC
jgi:hypothetical protein